MIRLGRQPDAQDVLRIEDAELDLVAIEELACEMHSAALNTLAILGAGIRTVNAVRIPVV